MWCYRRLLRISRTQHKTNEWILRELEFEREHLGPGEIIETGLLWTHDRKIRKFGKRIIIQGCTPGNRSRGRQRIRWTDDIIEWTGLAINEAAGSTEDRDRWRGILRTANRSSAGRHWTTMTTTTTLTHCRDTTVTDRPLDTAWNGDMMLSRIVWLTLIPY